MYKLLTILSSKKLLANYKTIFLRINSKQGINTPKEYSIPEFTNYNKQLWTPFAIDTDFESNLKQVQKPKKDNADASYTDKCQEHIACNYGYKAVCIDKFSKPV